MSHWSEQLNEVNVSAFTSPYYDHIKRLRHQNGSVEQHHKQDELIKKFVFGETENYTIQFTHPGKQPALCP